MWYFFLAGGEAGGTVIDARGVGSVVICWEVVSVVTGGEAGGMVGDARGVGSVVICWKVASVVAGGEARGMVVNVRDQISIIKSEGKLYVHNTII